MAPSFRRFSDLSAELGEAPLWSAADNCLWWIDIEGQHLLRSEAPGGATRAWPTPGPIGCLALLPDGDLLAGIGTGLFRFDRRSGMFHRQGGLEAAQGLRFNDGAVDPAGRLWAGVMHLENRAPVGGLFRIGEDLAPVPVVEGLLTPNGIAFDGRRGLLYFSDSHASVRTVWVCDYDIATGEAGERRVFARFSDGAGRPDGAAIDAEGNYWIAATDAARLLSFRPDGHLRDSLAVPVTHPTKPAFGGPAFATLFLTSRRAVVPGKASEAGGLDRQAGFVLAGAAPVAGCPESLFGYRQEK